jgi:hypothetical protein
LISTPWTYAGSPPSLSRVDSTVTLVEGQTFCLSGPGGDMVADLPHGLFVLDTRVLSRWQLRINGHFLEPLAAAPSTPFEGSFVCRGHPASGQADADLVVLRHRSIGNGLRERIVVHNYGLETTQDQLGTPPTLTPSVPRGGRGLPVMTWRSPIASPFTLGGKSLGSSGVPSSSEEGTKDPTRRASRSGTMSRMTLGSSMRDVLL